MVHRRLEAAYGCITPAWKNRRRIVSREPEAILIGNAAAALHGAPVTTIDFNANLACVIAIKKAAGRSRDKAVLDVLLETLKQKSK